MCRHNCVVANDQRRIHEEKKKKKNPKFHSSFAFPSHLVQHTRSPTQAFVKLNLTTSASIPHFQNLSGNQPYSRSDYSQKAQTIRTRYLDRQTSLLFEIDTISPAIPSADATLPIRDQVHFMKHRPRAARTQSNPICNQPWSLGLYKLFWMYVILH